MLSDRMRSAVDIIRISDDARRALRFGGTVRVADPVPLKMMWDESAHPGLVTVQYTDFNAADLAIGLAAHFAEYEGMRRTLAHVLRTSPDSTPQELETRARMLMDRLAAETERANGLAEQLKLEHQGHNGG